jgi:uncharacterized RDD family membrane protein YckC
LSREARLERFRAQQGLRAGFVSRILALAIDVAMLFVFGFLILGFIALIRWVTTSQPLRLSRPDGIASTISVAALTIAYFSYLWTTTGRTMGEQLLGLRTVMQDGSRMSGRRSFVRAVLWTAFPIGIFWVLVSEKNASIQDLICSTAVVYDWSYHPPGG